MSQRLMLISAAALAALVLLIAGLFARGLSLSGAAGAGAGRASSISPSAAESQVNAEIAAYKTALDQANTQLAEANRRLAQANAQLQQAYSRPTTAPSPSAGASQAQAGPDQQYPISATAAAAIALAAAPGGNLSGTPSLVNLQGAIAYEVTLDLGKVYVDPTSGAVLYNQAALSLSQQGFGRDANRRGGDDR